MQDFFSSVQVILLLNDMSEYFFCVTLWLSLYWLRYV